MGLPPINTRPKIDLSSLPILEIPEPKEAPKKEPSLREGIDLSALNLDKKQAEAPEGIDLSSLGGYFKQATIPEGPEYQAPPVDPGDESLGATIDRMLAQTTTMIPTAVRGGAELLRKGIVEPLIAPFEGLSPEHGKSLRQTLSQPLLDLEQLAAEKQQGAEELFSKTVKPASSKPITFKSLKDAPVETLHRALNRTIENAPTTIGQLAVTSAAPLLGFGLNAALETGSTAASIDALEAEGVKVNPEYKKTVNTVAGVTKAIPDFFSDRLLLKILGSRAGLLPKFVMTALESFTEGGTEGVQNLIDVVAEQGATLTPEEVKNFGKYLNDTFNLAKINPGAAAAYLGINAPRRLLGKTPAEQALNLMRTEEATIVGGLAGGLYAAPGLLNTGRKRVTGEQLTPEQIAQLPDGTRKALASGQPASQPKIDLSALGLPSGEPRGLLQEGSASRPAEPREFIAGQEGIRQRMSAEPPSRPAPSITEGIQQRPKERIVPEARTESERVQKITSMLENLREPAWVVLSDGSKLQIAESDNITDRGVILANGRKIPFSGIKGIVDANNQALTDKPIKTVKATAVPKTPVAAPVEQKAQQTIAPKTTIRKPAQKGDGTPTSANFKEATKIAKESFIATKGKPADVQFKEAAAALKAANVHPVIIDEITNPDRFPRPGEPGEKSDATTRRGRYERAVAPPKELQPGLNRITDTASDFNKAKADYEAAKTDLLGILKQRGVEIITADDGVTPKDIRVLKGKTNLSPAAQRVIKDAIQEAAQKGGFSAETVGQGFQMSVTPVKAFPGERLQGNTFAEQLKDFLKKHKAVKNAEAAFKRAKNFSFDALVDDYLAKRVAGKEGSAYRGEGKNNQAEIYVRRKLSASDPDIEPFRSQIKALRKKLTSEETQRGADYLKVTDTSGASRVRIAEGKQERITVPKEPAVGQEELFSEFKPSYETSVANSEKAYGLAKTAVENLAKNKKRGGVHFLANAISAAARNRGVVKLVGQPVRNADDVATLAQVYRDPKWETLRYVFIKDGKVVETVAFSSRLPHKNAAFPNMEGIEGVTWLRDIKHRTKADGYYIVHNHPTGDSKPSRLDLNMTEGIASQVSGFQGHVVIDSNEYSVISKVQKGLLTEFVTETKTADFGVDQLLKPSVEHPLNGRPIKNAKEVFETLKHAEQKEGWATLVAVNADAHVAGIGQIEEAVLSNPSKKRSAIIRGFARNTGSPNVFVVASPQFIDKNLSTIRKGIEQNFIYDVVNSLTGESVLQQLNQIKPLNRKKDVYFGSKLKSTKPIFESTITADDIAKKTDFESGSVVENQSFTIGQNNIIYRPTPENIENLVRNQHTIEIPIVSFDSLHGKKVFIFASDRLKVGTYTGLHKDSGIEIPLYGGPLFPFIRENYGKSGWAVSNKKAQTTMLNRIKNSDGIGLAMLQGKQGVTGSKTFLNIFLAELQQGIRSRDYTTKDLLKLYEQARKKILLLAKKENVANKAKGFRNVVGLDILRQKPASIKDLIKLLSAMPFKIQASVLARLASKTNIKEYGLPDTNKIVDLITEDAFKDAEYGDIVAAIQFKPEAGTHKEIGSIEHPSYGIHIAGKGLGIFDKFVDVHHLLKTKAAKAQTARSAMLRNPIHTVAKEPAVVREEQPAYKTKREIPDTIQVDGKERPTRNSNGQLIHSTLKGIENFWKWFSGSRIVDDQGRPLVVYHGTTARKVAVLKKSFEAGSGIFLTDNEDVASTFTTPREYGEPVFEDERGRPIKPGDTVAGYLKIENPFVLPKNDAQRFVDDTTYQVEILREAKAAGNDGVIANDVMEGIGEQFKSTNYVAWSSNQVKSIRNRGAFSPIEPSILKEEQTGYSTKDQNAQFKKQPPYEPNYKKRPDASEKTDRWAREIVDGIGKGRKQGRVILANAINNQFRNESTADLIGQDVRTSDDVAVLAQVFRNPKTETMRYVLVKDGKAVHTTGVTSRLPSSTAIFPYADTEEGLAWLGELMALHKADGYYIIHNHPSGNATASPDDVKQTETIANGVKGFKGHVIVDSNEYTVIDSSFRPAKQVRNFGEDALLTPSLDHPVLGTKVDSNEAIADIAKRLQTPKGWVTLIGTSKGRVRSIMEVEEAQLSDLKKAAAIARRFATQTGSANIYLHTSDQFWNDNLTTLTKGIKEGFIIDAVSEKGNSADEWLAERTSVFGKERVTKQFGKEAPAGKVVGEASAVMTETIKVDGKERPTRNSDGKLIHPTKEGIENFWRWFGDSKVVDAQGRPLVVYHGSEEKFEAFDPEKKGSRDVGFYGSGFYFTTDGGLALKYAKLNAEKVLSVYVKAENPLDYDSMSKSFWDTVYEKIPQEQSITSLERDRTKATAITATAQEKGYDSIIKRFGKNEQEIIVFEPTQIKSAIGNRGTFSPTEPSIVREAQSARDKGVTIGVEENKNKVPSLNRMLEIVENTESEQGGRLYPEKDDNFDEDEYRFSSKKAALEYVKNEIFPFFDGLSDKVAIYRAVRAENVRLDPYDIGESWSFDLDAAKEFGRHAGANKIIKAYTSKGNIDYDTSVANFHLFSHIGDSDAEFEFFIPSNSKLENVVIEDLKTATPLPVGNIITKIPAPNAAKTEQPKLKNKLFDHLTTEERAELEASFKESKEAFKNVQARLDFGLFDPKLQKNFILASKAVLKALSRAAKSSFVKFGDWSKEMVKLYGQKISSYLTPLWNAITPTSLNIGDEVFINGRPVRIKSKLSHHGSNAINNTQGRAPNHAKRIRNVLFEVVADDYADTVKPLNSALADRMRKIADAYKLFDGRIRHAVNLTELEKRIRDARFNWTKNFFQGDSPTANLETVYFDEHGNGYTALTQIITDPANNTPDNLTELEKDIVKTYRKILDIAKTLHKRFGLVDSELEDIPNKPRVALTYEAKDVIYTTKEAAPLYQAIVNGLAKANRTQDVKSFKLKAEDVIARRIDGEWEVRSTKDREWQEVDDPQAINRLERVWVRDTLETRGIGTFETFPNYVTLDGKPIPITANNVFDALSALSAETAKISALAREFGPHYRQFLTREQELLRDKGLNTKPITDWLDAYFNRRPVPERFIQSRGSAIGSIKRFGRLVDATIKTAALSASAPLQFPSVLMALHLTGYKPFFKGAADTFRAVVNRKGVAELAAMGAVHREVYNFSIKKGEIFEDMANAIRQTGGRVSYLQQANKFQSYFTAFGMQAFADQLIKQGGKLSRDQVATLVSLDFTADDLKKIRAGEMKKGDSLYSAIVGRSVRYVTGEGLTGGENSRFLRSPMAQLLFPFSRWPVLQMKRFSKEYQIAKKLLRQGDYKTWFNRTARLFGGAVLAGELQFLLGAMLFGTTMKDAWERPDEEMWERLMNDLLAGAILGPFSRLAWIALQSEQTAERIAASATFWGNIAYDVVNMLSDSHEFANQTWWEKGERLLRKRLPAMKYIDGFRQNMAVLGLGKANDLEYRALKNLRRKWLEENDLGTSYDRRGYRESTVQFRKIYERLVEGNQDINEILGEVLKVKEQELLDKAIKEGREIRGIDEQDAIRSLKASLKFRKFFTIDGKDMSETQLAGLKAFMGESRYAQMAAHDKLIDELINSLGTTSRARRRR